MKKSLIKHEDGLVLQIDQDLLDKLGVDADTAFDVTTDGQKLVITPLSDTARQEKFAEALSTVNAQYPDTLRILGE